MTLEQAQQQILDLQDQLATVTAERDTLSENNNTLTAEVEDLRTLNQKLFLRTQANHTPTEEPEEDPPVPTCEEYAKTITLF